MVFSQHQTPPRAIDTASSSTAIQAFLSQILVGDNNFLEVAKLETTGQKEVGNTDMDSSMPISLKAISAHGRITLEWTSTDPSDRFNILRSETEEGEYVQINGSTISAPEEILEKVKYTYTDAQVAPAITYYYKLEWLTAEGRSTFVGPIPATPQLALSQSEPGQKEREDNRHANK